MQVKSRFNFTYFYLPLVIAIITIAGGFYVGLHPALMVAKNGKGSNDIPPLVLVFLGILLLFIVARTKAVTITANSIIVRSLFNKQSIGANDIASADVFSRGSKGAFWMSVSSKTNGITIKTKNGGSLFIPGFPYKNIIEIKQAIKTNFGRLSIEAPPLRSSSNMFNAPDETFAGDMLLSKHSITVLALTVIAFVFMAVLVGITYITLLAYIAFTSLLWLAASNQLNYFIVSGKKLLVKNHIRRWKIIELDLDDIEQAVVEDNYRQANSLRINFKNFKSRCFGAASLTRNTWRALLKRLSSVGIDTQMEA